MKALFIHPASTLDQLGGSSNRMNQCLEFLRHNCDKVDVLSIGPHEQADIKCEFSLKSSGNRNVPVPSGYDLYFVNYLFVLEKLVFEPTVKIFLDLHDDLINRDERLNANWFTRTEKEALQSFTANTTVLHISIAEQHEYVRKFPNLKHFFFPYFPTKIGSEYLNRRAARFDFGFIGSQNSVNAKSLKNAVEFMERASCDFNILVAGAIAKGISKAPHYVNTVPSIELHEFYSSIKWLLVMHPDQSGTCTKLIESLSFGVPVIAPISLLRNIPLNIDPMPMNKNFGRKSH